MANGMVFLAGFLFTTGLGISGMTQPARIVGFLDVTGAWDPSLILVIMAAVATYAAVYAVAHRRARPILAPRFVWPTARGVDVPLVVGSALFGVGWGMTGFCPGVSLAALVSLKPQVLAFLGPMLLGIGLYEALPYWREWQRRLQSHRVHQAFTGLVDG